jgi:hypothetical protein
MCSYAHVLNLLWGPTIAYIEAVCRYETPEWTKSLGLIQAAILSSMFGIVGYIGETLEMDMFLDFIHKALYRLLNAHVPTQMVRQVVGVCGASET